MLPNTISAPNKWPNIYKNFAQSGHTESIQSTPTSDDDVDEKGPEVVLNGRRIFWMEGEEVAHDQGRIVQGQASQEKTVADDEVQKAKYCVRVASQVDDQCVHLFIKMYVEIPVSFSLFSSYQYSWL